jgi:hypothetical protein
VEPGKTQQQREEGGECLVFMDNGGQVGGHGFHSKKLIIGWVKHRLKPPGKLEVCANPGLWAIGRLMSLLPAGEKRYNRGLSLYQHPFCREDYGRNSSVPWWRQEAPVL